MYIWRAGKPADILRKCFSHCPEWKMWKFFKTAGQRTALISCIDIGSGWPVLFLAAVPHNLSECEAQSRYCCHGLFHSLPLNDRTFVSHFSVCRVKHIDKP